MSTLPNRRSIRLQGYDYANKGHYFVTICTFNKKALFGKIVGGTVHLSEYGRIVSSIWEQIPCRYEACLLDAYIIMPNHMHGIITIQSHATHPLGTMMRGFKSAVSKECRRTIPNCPEKIWHRNYYERIIRDTKALNAIRHYIKTNPIR